MAELLINGSDAQTTYGIRMGKGFRDTLLAPAGLKEFIENKSRLKHGKTVITNNPKMDSRDMTLTFYIHASGPTHLQERRAAFFTELYKGGVDISAPPYGSEIYHLVYKKATSYGQNIAGTFCKVAVKFEEPDPSNRT